MSLVVHAVWFERRLCLWAEDPSRWSAAAEGSSHPHAADEGSLRAALASAIKDRTVEAVRVPMRVPATDGRPMPSLGLAHELGLVREGGGAAATIGTFETPALAVDAVDAFEVLDAVADLAETRAEGEGTAHAGASLLFFVWCGRLAQSLMAEQRFVPVIRQDGRGETTAGWQPWLSDEKTAEKVAALVRSMPGSARAAVDERQHEPWAILEDFFCRTTDAVCRRSLERESFIDAVAERDPAKDQPVAMLRGILGSGVEVTGTPAVRQEMVRRVRQWVGGLEERGASSAWRLLLRLAEPLPAKAEGAGKSTKPVTDDDAEWALSFHLQSVDVATLVVDAADVWALPTDTLTVAGRRIDQPQELLLGELGRASRIYKRLEAALGSSDPVDLTLNTKQAYEFLREMAPLLKEQGFAVHNPEWWDSPLARLGARLKIESEDMDPSQAILGGAAKPSQLGLGALVRYRWEIALGDTTLTLQEFEQLAAKKSPLVRVNGRWVEIRPEDVHAAIRFMRENPGGEMSVGDALRMAYASDVKQTGVPIVGLEATGWVQALMNAEVAAEKIRAIEPPKGFHGTLRPYQLRGLAWMAFLEGLGLSMCLADDMGLGKTIQLLGLLAMERETRENAIAAGGVQPAAIKPTLLVVPMSVVGNWIHETRRFCPELKVMVHHGAGRQLDAAFVEAARASDLIITTYTLAHRDRTMFEGVEWGRIVLDEAQYIKNPLAKQSQAVRAIRSDRRVALTGTPVENRLSELWSILDFLNPGYLGSAGGFRTRFAVAIERYRDRAKGEQLKGLIRPFVLRRLKSDPNVVADLPSKVETREYAPLTSEQAELYEACVKRMLAEIDRSEGIQRRGMVLAGLIKLKQICNHPSQMLKDWTADSGRPPVPARSGKCIRLLEMLEELVSLGDQALVFTQFRQMGNLLMAMVKHHLDKDVLFLHGGVPQQQRVQMVETFQRADGKHPVMLVSLKAGGVGLNLTAATHVFHFDRWWNPAVENQATDRAYRIGQTRTVQVHKFVVRGTLEERIDQMLEQKTELAEKIIGAGEQWLTELNSDQLRDLLTLRNDAISDEV